MQWQTDTVCQYHSSIFVCLLFSQQHGTRSLLQITRSYICSSQHHCYELNDLSKKTCLKATKEPHLKPVPDTILFETATFLRQETWMLRSEWIKYVRTKLSMLIVKEVSITFEKKKSPSLSTFNDMDNQRAQL
ncbi:hypothetical protein GJ496_003754 [Pomphorhynchus laevis]|nr:hypothetical protein GJ496_003754 [Pomphorhynchus laevis]